MLFCKKVSLSDATYLARTFDGRDYSAGKTSLADSLLYQQFGISVALTLFAAESSIITMKFFYKIYVSSACSLSEGNSYAASHVKLISICV